MSANVFHCLQAELNFSFHSVIWFKTEKCFQQQLPQSAVVWLKVYDRKSGITEAFQVPSEHFTYHALTVNGIPAVEI